MYEKKCLYKSTTKILKTVFNSFYKLVLGKTVFMFDIFCVFLLLMKYTLLVFKS